MIVKCDSNGIIDVKKILEKDGIIIFPTDTVYGIGCNPVSYTHLTLPTILLV